MDHASTALWIDNDAALDAFVQSAHPSGVIGMDTEFMRRDSYYARLALLQIHLDGRTALIDPLAVAPNAALRGRLEHPDSVCVMHSAGEDIETLANWLPAGPARLFDTQIAAALAGFGSGLGYQKLVEAITGVQLSKGETRSDWLQRPLTAAQKDYAALDVIHLDALHAALDARLGELGRREWLAEDCAKLCRRADRAAFDPQPQLALRAAAEWPAEQQALLRRLLLWREQTARRIDAPRPWLIDDKQALSLAEQPPHSLDELSQRTRGQRALRGEVRRDLLATLTRPLDPSEITATHAIPFAPGRDDRKSLDALKQAVDGLAAELDLPAGLLCPRRLLEELLMTRRWPEALSGWRTPLLQPRLQALLA